jgi:hypothetical protein
MLLVLINVIQDALVVVVERDQLLANNVSTHTL